MASYVHACVRASSGLERALHKSSKGLGVCPRKLLSPPTPRVLGTAESERGWGGNSVGKE